MFEHVEELANEHLESELAVMASRLWALTARFVELVGEFDRRESWRSWGCRSSAEWLSWQCGVSPGTARDQVRVARKLRELPRIAAAFMSGELSYSKTRALGRVATPATEEVLLRLARHATAHQLERVLAYYRRSQRSDGDEAGAFADRDLRWHHRDEETMVFTLQLPTDLGMAVVAALNAGADALREHDKAVVADAERVSAETAGAGTPSAETDQTRRVSAETPVVPRSVGQRRADALVELVTSGSIGGSPVEVELQVEVEAATLVAGQDGGCSIGGTVPLHPNTARLLGCDTVLSTLVTGPHGEVLDIGRRSRTLPRRLRRALERRDGGCVVDGCPRRGHLQGHHVVYWSEGGPTSLDNLVLLCWFHHRLVHQDVLSVELVDGQPVCRRADRRPPQRLVAPPMDTDDVLEELARMGVPTELAANPADGERLDWTCAIDGISSAFAYAERQAAGAS